MANETDTPALDALGALAQSIAARRQHFVLAYLEGGQRFDADWRAYLDASGRDRSSRLGDWNPGDPTQLPGRAAGGAQPGGSGAGQSGETAGGAK